MTQTKAVQEPGLQEQFAKFLKEKRQALGMSQPDLAEKVFGDRKKKTYISEIESGKRKGITLNTVEKILLELNNTKISFIE